MARYYGYYSNVSRGKQNWARLIQKIYEVDPLNCPKCSGKMKVIPRIAG